MHIYLNLQSYSGISLNNLFKSGYYRKFEKRQKNDIAKGKSLQIENSHLRSFYSLQQDIEECVSRKVETIRKRAQSLEAEQSFEKDVTSKRLARKGRNDKKGKTISKNASQSNIIKPQRESYDNSIAHRSRETLKWKESDSDTKMTLFDQSIGMIKNDVHTSLSGHQSYQGHPKQKNYESGKQIPYRLPKLQIGLPKHTTEDGQLDLKSSSTNCMTPSSSGESCAPSAELHRVTSEERFQLPSSSKESEHDEARQLRHLEESATGISNVSQHRFTKRSRKSTRERPKMKEIKPSSSVRVRRGQVSEVGDGSDEAASLERETTVEDSNDEHSIDCSTLEISANDQMEDSDEMPNITDSDGNTLEETQHDIPKTIKLRPNPLSRAKWDPNSRSDVMRRKLDNLMRRRRMARLDKIRLGGIQGPEVGPKSQTLPDPTEAGISRKRTEMESYEYLPELNKKGKIERRSKRRRKRKTKLRSTTKSFSFSYFS